MKKALAAAIFSIVALAATAGGQLASETARVGSLTGNWAVKTQRPDGTWSKAYFNLKRDGDKIRGTIRSTQFFYTIVDSTGDANGFSLTASMKDGKSDRTVKYEGKLDGDELHLSTKRRPEDKPTEIVARRVVSSS